MKTEIKSLLWLIVVSACTLPLQAADYGTFESFYEVPLLSPWEWALLVGGTVAAAVAAFFIGLCLRVVRNVIEEATRINTENDFK